MAKFPAMGMRQLVLLGAGGHASDVLGLVETINRSAPTWEVVGVADDDIGTVSAARFADRAVVLDATAAVFEPGHAFVAAVGYPEPRRRIAVRAEQGGLEAVALVHPRVELGTGCTVGAGTVVLAGALVSPGVRLGRHALVHNGAIVGHDASVADFASLMPGCTIGGGAVVGAGALVGAGATVLQGLRLGDGCVVGAGAVVTTDVAPGATVVGVPARVTSTS